MKAILFALLVTTCLAAAHSDQVIRLCGAHLAEALNIMCTHRDATTHEPPSYDDIYENHVKPLVKTRNDAHPNRRLSLVEQCCAKECRLMDLVDYCPQ